MIKKKPKEDIDLEEFFMEELFEELDDATSSDIGARRIVNTIQEAEREIDTGKRGGAQKMRIINYPHNYFPRSKLK